MGTKIELQLDQLKIFLKWKLNSVAIAYLANCASWDDIKSYWCYKTLFDDEEILAIYNDYTSLIWDFMGNISDYAKDTDYQSKGSQLFKGNVKRNYLLLMLADMDNDCLAVSDIGFKKLLVILAVIAVCGLMVEGKEVII